MTSIRDNAMNNVKFRKLLSEKKGKLPHNRWICHECGRFYPNQMLYCPKDNISRKHNENLWKDRPGVKVNE